MHTCSCFFLDVGQGTSHLLYLGAGRAIIFDTGAPTDPNCKIIQKALSDCSIKQIEALIISHSDADHLGNAVYLIQNCIDKIKKIYLVHDKIHESKVVKNFWSFLSKKYNEKNGNSLRKKIIPFNAPQTILDETINGDHVKMDILFPTYSHAVETKTGLSQDANRASAITLFSVGERKILFTGDVPFKSFQWIYDEHGKINADIIAVPHHGGYIGADSIQLNQLYKEYISGSYAVISVGNKNTYQHPKSETLTVLKNCGYEVMCTQITDKCCPIQALDQWKQKRQYEGLEYSASSRNPSSENNACMGTIRVDINSENLIIASPANYMQIKNKLHQLEGATPLCLD